MKKKKLEKKILKLKEELRKVQRHMTEMEVEFFDEVRSHEELKRIIWQAAMGFAPYAPRQTDNDEIPF